MSTADAECMLLRRSSADVFRIQVISNPDVRSPIITLGSTSFFHTRVNNLYLVAVTKYACLPFQRRCSDHPSALFLPSLLWTRSLSQGRMQTRHSYSSISIASPPLRARISARSTRRV
jgi:hypothetical protein